VHEYILRTLRDAIMAGELSPGQKLVEADLHAKLKVSRPSLREALRQLESERLVRITPHKGPSVAEITWPEADQIYEVRELLEGHAAMLFASRATDAEVLAVRKALEAFEAATQAPAHVNDLLEPTKAFYDVILQGCGNQVIADMLLGLFARINLLRSWSMSLPARSAESAREMRQLYLGIEARDAKAAKAAAIYHVRQARRAAQEAFAAHSRRAAFK
jgi:Transcriptional regulators